MVGKEVLKKNWKGVIELILSANDADPRADEVKKYFFRNRKHFSYYFIELSCKTGIVKKPWKKSPTET